MDISTGHIVNEIRDADDADDDNDDDDDFKGVLIKRASPDKQAALGA